MHENYVWGIESGLRNVSAINLLHLAAALQVHPRELWREFKISDLTRLPEKSAARLRSGDDTARSKR
jgi:transcriptional regulator with XRE-family HTH domain